MTRFLQFVNRNGRTQLRGNVVLNLAAWVLPAICAVIAIPIVARGLGPHQFGMVALAWSAVGLFSFFDFGLGRALTRIVACRTGEGERDDIPDLVVTSALMLGAACLPVTVVGLVMARTIATRLLHVPPALQHEAVIVVRWLVIGILPMAHGVVLRGVLEGEQRFLSVNLLRVPLGIATYLAPLLVLPLRLGAGAAVGLIVCARIVYWLAHLPLIARLHPGVVTVRRWSRAAARELVHVGGWITISNFVSPIMVQADRIVIAVALPIAASGWYGTAAEVATKQWLFTAALQPVLFAALSACLLSDPVRATQLMETALRVTTLALFPIALLLVTFAAPALHFWMRGAFAAPAVDVLRWLSIAVFVNANAQIPYAALQSGADSRSPALLHLIELPLYIGLLLVMVRTFGVAGVAMAYTARMLLDAGAMWALAARHVAGARRVAFRALRLNLAMTACLAVAWWAVARHG